MNIIRRHVCNNKIITKAIGKSHSTRAQDTASSNSKTSILFRRLHRAGDPRICLKPLLNQWVEEGKHVKKWELHNLIKQLRSFRRYSHALQVSEWMSDQQNHAPTVADCAIRLDLISKVHGLLKAEEYFGSIPENMKDFQSYGALLNCYAHNKNLENAEALFQKMKDLGFVKKPVSYNVMLSLYNKIGMYEKLDILMKEMEENGVGCDLYSYNIRLTAYVASSDVEGMEMFLAKMEANPFIHLSWGEYTVAADGYLKAGIIDKAAIMLKKSEELFSGQTRKKAFEMLLTLYASLGKKDDVYRIWSIYKKIGRVSNSGYLVMISSLLKLNDFCGAEELFSKWESKHAYFDIRIPNLLLSKYCYRGLPEKAEELIKRLINSGKELNASTWDRLATGYRLNGQLPKAVEALEKAISSYSPSDFSPNPFTLAACLEYLKHKGDLQVAESILKSVREQGLYSTEFRKRFENYIRDLNSDEMPLDLMKARPNVQDEEINEFTESNKDNSQVM